MGFLLYQESTMQTWINHVNMCTEENSFRPGFVRSWFSHEWWQGNWTRVCRSVDQFRGRTGSLEVRPGPAWLIPWVWFWWFRWMTRCLIPWVWWSRCMTRGLIPWVWWSRCMTRCFIPGVVSSNDMGSVRSHLEGEIVGNKRGRWSNSSFEEKNCISSSFFFWKYL